MPSRHGLWGTFVLRWSFWCCVGEIGNGVKSKKRKEKRDICQAPSLIAVVVKAPECTLSLTESCWMLLSFRNPSPALGVELNTLLLHGVQTMDRYPRPLPSFLPPHTSHPLLHTQPQGLSSPQAWFLGPSFYIKSQLFFDFLLAFVSLRHCLSVCGHDCRCRSARVVEVLLSVIFFFFFTFSLDLSSFHLWTHFCACMFMCILISYHKNEYISLLYHQLCNIICFLYGAKLNSCFASSHNTHLTCSIAESFFPHVYLIFFRHHTVTRGITKGVKEDFRLAMERQVSRCGENLLNVLHRFCINEKIIIIQSLPWGLFQTFRTLYTFAVSATDQMTFNPIRCF